MANGTGAEGIGCDRNITVQECASKVLVVLDPWLTVNGTARFETYVERGDGANPERVSFSSFRWRVTYAH